MIKKILLFALIAAFLAPMTASAGMYIGASIGNSWAGYDQPAIDDVGDISENSTGYKFFGGFKSESFFGVEGGYRDLGKIEYSQSGYSLDSSTTGWDIEAMGRVKIAIVDVFAKAGAFWWKTGANGEFAGEFSTENEDGTAFIWGLGAGVRLGPIGVRLEWESMEVKSPDSLSMLSLGATLGF